MLPQERVLAHLEEAGAVRRGGHYVYASGRHGDAYVNKDAVYVRADLTSTLALHMALGYKDDPVEVVAGPVIGGVILSTWVAWHLGNWGRRDRPLAVFAEKRGRGFRFGRGYDKLLAGKRVLVVEDVLTTGGSAKRVVAAVRRHGGDVIGVSALINRGGVDASAVGAPRLSALADVRLASWPADGCPLCASGVPVDVTVGKGREFLARRSAS